MGSSNPENEPERRLDLDRLAQRGTYNVEIRSEESDAEVASRTRREKFELWKDLALSVAGLFLIGAVAGVSLWIVYSGSYTIESKTQAWSVLSLIAGGIVGYLYGKASSR